MNSNKGLVLGVVAIVIAIVGCFLPVVNGKSALGATGDWTAFSKLESSAFAVGSGCGNTFGTCTGSVTSGFNFGACQIQAASATIAASSTATVDCVLAAGTAPGTALTGVTTNDNVSLTFSTTTPTTFEGLQVRGTSASSTPGYITATIYNGTGTTFTWTAAASTSPVYRAWR